MFISHVFKWNFTRFYWCLANHCPSQFYILRFQEKYSRFGKASDSRTFCMLPWPVTQWHYYTTRFKQLFWRELNIEETGQLRDYPRNESLPETIPYRNYQYLQNIVMVSRLPCEVLGYQMCPPNLTGSQLIHSYTTKYG